MPKSVRNLFRWDRRSVAAILIVSAVLLPLAIWQTAQVRLENNVDSWLPAGDRQARVLAWYRSQFPAGDQILVTWDGSTLDDPRVERLTSILRNDLPAHVENVITPGDLVSRMVQYGVAKDEAVRRVQGVLIGRADAVDGASDTRPAAELPVALAVALVKQQSTDRSAALDAIRRAAAEVGISADALHVAGGPIAGSELNAAVRRAAWDPTASIFALHDRSLMALAVAASIVLSFIMLRSVRLAVAVLLTSVFATVVATALIPLTNGSMNMLLVVMPPLLFVTTVSGAIHVANYWTHAAARNRRTATCAAFRAAAVPCALASVTTALGLISLGTSSLSPIWTFGVYSAIGCLISLTVVLFVLPALLHCLPGKSRVRAQQPVLQWEAIGRFLCRWHLQVAVAATVLFAAGAYGLRWFEAENKVINYFAESTRVMQDYRALEDRLAGVVPVETVVRFNADARERLTFLERLELVRSVQNEIRKHPSVTGALSLADFQPVNAVPAADASFWEKAGFNKKSHEMQRRAGDAGSEARAFYTTARTDADLYETGDRRLSAEGDELWRITAQTWLLGNVDYEALTSDLDWIARSALKPHDGTGYVVTGSVPLLLKTQQALLASLVQSFGLAMLLIASVMAVLLRNVLAGLLSLLPNLLPVVVVFGLISWSGMVVDIGSMMTASVALGIAVDGTLHLLTWFRRGLADGLTRTEAVSQALRHCGPALWQTNAAVGLGLLTLMPSELVLISRFGWLMAALIGASVIANLVFLPALLAGPLGWTIERRLRPAAELDAETAGELGLDVLGLESPQTALSLGAAGHGPAVRID